ncbi:MAG TPA: succinate dehydrogenase/fumarate reductase iron-sulfur subunit [Planctomycetota bacterium]|nr:succinate dehydrogenase/fumarate reductase iron-sulfur subunit [Planctomycetota bacterium]
MSAAASPGGAAAAHGATLRLTLKVWRQAGRGAPGGFETYVVDGVSEHASFLELLDVLNAQLVEQGRDPVAFDHDCREGICGSCGLVIDGRAHGPDRETATCQLHLRRFRTGDTIVVEPFRSRAFPVLKDLFVDRGAFDRVMQAGGYVSANTGAAPDANAIPVPKAEAELAMDAAACIGCGACVAACPNGAAMLFVAAKIAHLGRLPQGEPEAGRRAVGMVEQMDAEGFGNCTNHYECGAACPKGIAVENIARLNRDYLGASLRSRP